MSSSTLDNLIHKANALIASNNLNEAMAAYEKICRIDKANPSAWLALGSLAGNIGKFEDAEAAFNKAVNLQSHNVKAIELLAQAQEASGKNSSALKTLLSLNNAEENPELLLRIAVLHGKTGDFQESIRCLIEHNEHNQSNPGAYHCLASAYESIGDFDNAGSSYKQAIKLSPGSFNLHNSYGAMLHKNSQWDSALEQYKIALKYIDDNPIVHYNIASLFNALGYYQNAVDHFVAALNFKSNFIEAMVGLGKVNRSLGDYNKAIELYNKVLSIRPDSSEAYANMGLVYVAMSEFETAMMHLKKADELDPGNIEIISEIASLHERMGEFCDAEHLIRPLLLTHRHHNKVATTYGALSRSINEQESAITILEETIDNGSMFPPATAEIHYLLGKLYNDAKDYDSAFEHYNQANILQPDTYDRNEIRESLQKRAAIYTRDTLLRLPRISDHENIPIFIVGMPRSGTTLIEQILASHSNIYGAGELQHLTNVSTEFQRTMMNAAHDSTLLNTVEPDYLQELAGEYLHLSKQNAHDEQYTTDKMPHNFLLLGIIQVLFPNAIIIHSRRNPIDNCLSIFFSNLNALHPYAGKLEHIADYYSEFYLKLMDHWKQELDIEILDIDYEDLVSNQEEVSRRIIQFCGLEWEDNCLKYYETSRNVTTISYDQVRQPIYKSSVERWRKYKDHIAPLLKHFDSVETNDKFDK